MHQMCHWPHVSLKTASHRSAELLWSMDLSPLSTTVCIFVLLKLILKFDSQCLRSVMGGVLVMGQLPYSAGYLRCSEWVLTLLLPIKLIVQKSLLLPSALLLLFSWVVPAYTNSPRFLLRVEAGWGPPSSEADIQSSSLQNPKSNKSLFLINYPDCHSFMATLNGIEHWQLGVLSSFLGNICILCYIM